LLEREVKLLFPTTVAARDAVLAAGAVLADARRLQDDSLYDLPDETLRSKGCVVRIRTERWTDRPDTTTLTVKGPMQSSQMKLREEHETRVENAQALLQAFDALGMRVWFRYQKHREEFSRPGLVVAIDETPVGTYVELEGDEDAILAMATALGRTPADFIVDSYYRLFMKRRDELGLVGPFMVFSASGEATADKPRK
jgi:adenylate cyclase, class 2